VGADKPREGRYTERGALDANPGSRKPVIVSADGHLWSFHSLAAAPSSPAARTASAGGKEADAGVAFDISSFIRQDQETERG
jgi:hypothetical protein